jgi:hypothetical protein
MAVNNAVDRVVEAPSHEDEKDVSTEKNEELIFVSSEENLAYDDVDEEPELHFRTYVAVAAMFLQNLVQLFALQGPPAVVG